MFMKPPDPAKPLGKNGATLDLLREKWNLEKSSKTADIQSSTAGPKPKLLQIFDGAENDDNAFGLGILLAPPDTDGDVGINHYVQMTNLVTTIFDKTGNVVLGPFAKVLIASGYNRQY